MVTYSITTSITVAATTTTAGDTASTPPGTGYSYATGSAAIPTTAPAADWIVIEFFLGAGIGLWVCSSSAFTGSAGATPLTPGQASTLFLPAGQSQPTTVFNLQPSPNWNVKAGVPTYYSGFDGAKDQSLAWNMTAQSGFAGTHNAGHWPFGPNFLAFVPDAATVGTGRITVTFQ